MDRIKISCPMIGEREIENVRKVMLSGDLIQGEWVEEFERKMAGYIGTRHAVATSSGTSALQIGVEALGVGRGDEVVTTPFTFISSSNSILYNGARPVFVDIDSKTFNIDTQRIEEKITEKTRALLIVHLYGQPCDMGGITKICKKHGLLLIEDTAQAIGAEYNGRRAGSFGEVSMLSFYGTKNLTTGEGGMILSDIDSLEKKARLARNHGQIKVYEHEFIGYNHRMTNLAAAIGLAQFEKIESMTNKRVENAYKMSEALDGTEGVVLPEVLPQTKHVFHQYTIRVLRGRRDALAERLNQNGIEARIYYPKPVYMQKVYVDLGYSSISCPEAERACKEVLSIPIHPLVTDEQIDRIANSIKDGLKGGL